MSETTANSRFDDTLEGEVYRLTEECLRGELDDNARQQLDSLLRENSEARQHYLDYIAQNSILSSWATSSSESSDVPSPWESVQPSDVASDTQPMPASRSLTWMQRASRRPKGPAIAIAVVVMVVALVGMAVTPVTEWIVHRDKQNDRNTPKNTEAESVAKISNWLEDEWAEDTRPPRQDPRLKVGERLVLKSGLVEVTYLCGARVVIEGPAEFVIGGTKAQATEPAERLARGEGEGGSKEGANSRGRKPVDAAKRGFLRFGKLTARVEGEEAKHFTVDTPYASIEDLGTEFGLVVDRRGVVDVHVFEGSVRTTSDQKDGGWQGEVELIRDESLRVEPGIAAPRRSAVDPAIFLASRTLRETLAAQANAVDANTIAYWRFEESVPAPDPQGSTQAGVVRSYAAGGLTLDYWPGRAEGIGAYQSSDDVPPTKMFRAGLDGGRRSFDFSNADPSKPGVLFFEAERHGLRLNFDDDFTIEGFFKTAGDQRDAGRMDILFHAQKSPCYWIGLNEKQPGGLRFNLNGTANGEPTNLGVDVAEKNFADGRWHYFAVQFDRDADANRCGVIVTVVDEDGNNYDAESWTQGKFEVSRSRFNTFIGRHDHMKPAGSFVGTIDELRISHGLRNKNQLLGKIQEEEKAVE